jgi:hypothetical protein
MLSCGLGDVIAVAPKEIKWGSLRDRRNTTYSLRFAAEAGPMLTESKNLI